MQLQNPLRVLHILIHHFEFTNYSTKIFYCIWTLGRPDMAYYKFTKSILENESIDVYNKGKMYRDFTYIDDVTKSIELLINKIPKIKDILMIVFQMVYLLE